MHHPGADPGVFLLVCSVDAVSRITLGTLKSTTRPSKQNNYSCKTK